MEPRAEADNTGPPLDMPDIGSEPCKPCHFNSPKRSFGKKNIVYTTRFKLHSLIDGGTVATP